MKEVLKAIEDIKFTDFREIYRDRFIIKKLYSIKSIDTKKVYKWYYYYQLCLLKPHYKDSMWLWLNDQLSDEELDLRYNEFEKIKDHQKNLYKFDKKSNI